MIMMVTMTTTTTAVDGKIKSWRNKHTVGTKVKKERKIWVKKKH
jgi:hypothetical protein